MQTTIATSTENNPMLFKMNIGFNQFFKFIIKVSFRERQNKVLLLTTEQKQV